MIFRLYFVDAPETDFSFPERVRTQAEYWGIDEKMVIELGKEAAEFTRTFLKDGFVVRSKREDAQGRSNDPRYYALVEVEGRSLIEALVAQGLARVYGYGTDLPDGTPAYKMWQRLRQLEGEARKGKRGAWRLQKR